MLKKKLRCIKAKLKEKKGASTVEFAIVMLIFVFLFSIGFEFIMLNSKYLHVADYANEITRVIAIQGGADNKVVSGFQGGNNAYKTTYDLRYEKDRFAESIGIDESKFKVYIHSGSQTFNLDTQGIIKIDYLQPFKIEVKVEPGLDVVDNFGEFVMSKILKNTKMGVSEFEHDYKS